MPPERYPLSQDDGDGGGGVSLTAAVNGGGTTIVGGHVTVETSSPVASPSRPGQFDVTTTPTSTVATPNNGSSMVLSTIPVETTHQLILQQHLAQQHHIITTGNANQNGSAISSGVTSGNTGIIINNNNNNNTSFKNHNNIIISSSGGLAASSNNHTYTINLSSGHNGHAVLTNGIPLQGYASVTTSNSSSSSNSTTLNTNHSHHHHQQHQQQQQQYHHLHPASNSAANGMATVHSNGTTTTVVAPPGGGQSLPPPSQSKLVVLQQGHLGENYITTTEGMNGVGNIVLLATEQMDSDHEIINNSGSGSNNLVITSSSSSSSSNSNNHGHALTHHQHHAAIRSAAATLTSNGVVVNGVGGGNDEELTPLTWLHDKNLLKGINLSKVPVSSPDSPRQVAGRLSPTSDFVEDSSVSEDNTSSANSSSDHSIGVYCTETIHPGGRPGTVHHSNLHHVQHAPHQQQQHHHTTFQLSNGSGHKTITTTINGDTIIEYTADDKELKSPSSTVSCASSSSSSPPSSSSSSLYSSSSPSPNPNTVVTSQGLVQNGGGGGSGASTPHQHFHKKYLREEHVKQLKQVSSSYATPVKQQSTLKFDDGDLMEERSYPSAPVKNGVAGGSYTMAASPNVSSDEYSSTYGGSMKPPSPPLSPQHLGAPTLLSGIHVLPQQQPPASPLPSPVGSNGSKLSPPKAKHPTNVPYDPQVHVHSKPPFSFSSLIFMAIENCQQKALPVKEIYAWIVAHFPYFKTAPTGWKNSVRHNLSLNKCFQKVEKAANLGKGSLWMVEPQYRPNLIQALSRSPFHSGSGIDKTTYKAMQAQQQQQQHQRSTDSPTSSVGSSYSKDNFPYLASRLAPGDAQSHLHHLHDQQHSGHPDLDGDDFSRSSTPIDYDGGDLPHQTVTAGSYHVTYHPSTVGTTNGINYSTTATTTATSGVGMLPNGIDGSASGADPNGRNWSADTIDDVNAATAMLALKHGPKVFTEGFHSGNNPVITTSPSEDHTYSAGGSIPPAGVTSGRSSQTNSDNNSNGTSSDAAYESSEESQTLNATDLEEQRRQAGVDALLNLAGITNYSTPSSSLKRPASCLEPESTQPPTTAVIYQQYLESTPPSGYSVVVQTPPAAHQHRNSYYLPADELTGHHHQYQSSPSPPKKSKNASARMLKKFKKKATWVR